MSILHISIGARSGAIVKSAAAGLVLFGTAFAVTGHASAEEVIVGLVTKTEVNPFFVKMRQAAEEEAKAKGVKLIARAGKFDGDNEGQVTAIEDLISAGAKGILVTPNNSTGMLGIIKKARDAGVLVIALDTATDPADAVDATFATDNFEAGVQQGAYARKALGNKKPVLAMLDGTPGGTVDTFRHNGYLKGFGLTEGDPAIAGSAITNGAQDKGQVGMENLLSKNGDINAVYTINEPAAAGAYAALKSFGKEGDVMLTSIDGGCAGVRNVKAGQIAATVMQFPYKMAANGVDAVVEYAASGKKPSGFVNTGSFLITDKPIAGIDSKDTEWGLKNCWGD
ncbi:substrate-binding domain-containing protein [Mesorhizobium sp. AR02]|uniref:substrate-binding domain-containing protein n=1 Tax=Mesorhizobium sp. AR02 TaxID=2865837 RepID=UPI00215E6D51|nr:substrate-binding domain-containing protein [Mesorhizobium sp. AR02]UVK54700.1 substrate-binding domain-containing protein [Mesorhizobium sp. AR02]